MTAFTIHLARDHGTDLSSRQRAADLRAFALKKPKPRGLLPSTLPTSVWSVNRLPTNSWRSSSCNTARSGSANTFASSTPPGRCVSRFWKRSISAVGIRLRRRDDSHHESSFPAVTPHGRSAERCSRCGPAPLFVSRKLRSGDDPFRRCRFRGRVAPIDQLPQRSGGLPERMPV